MPVNRTEMLSTYLLCHSQSCLENNVRIKLHGRSLGKEISRHGRASLELSAPAASKTACVHSIHGCSCMLLCFCVFSMVKQAFHNGLLCSPLPQNGSLFAMSASGRISTLTQHKESSYRFAFVSAFRHIAFPVSASEIGITFTPNHFDFI